MLMLAAVTLKPWVVSSFALPKTVQAAKFNKHEKDYDKFKQDGCQFRDVKVNDARDLHALLSISDPCAPTEHMLLLAITLDDGTRIEKPVVQDLRKLRPSKLRPVLFHWSDKSAVQYWAPSKYEDLIQRMLNCGPSELEDLVRANWKVFDKGFYFKLQSLRMDTTEPRLKEKIISLEKLSMEVIRVAEKQTQKSIPAHAEDAQAIITSMLEGDGETLLWPPPREAYLRLAEEITRRATRAKYEDGWFESILEGLERVATRMQAKKQDQMAGCTQIAMQRIVTEWLREDSLWEETDEGRFLFRLMSLSSDQWKYQLTLEESPLDATKLKDEIKIISENKVVNLPMGSKLQIYASKYLQGLLEFVTAQEKVLGSIEVAR